MIIPKNLQEKREELAKRRSSFQASSGCKLTDEVWRRHIEIGFEDGFDEACDLLLLEIKKLEEAIKSGAHYLTFHSQGKGATEFFQMNEDANKILKALQSLREFLGEESEGKNV